MKCSGNESMQMWCVTAFLSLFLHTLPALSASTSSHLRSRAQLRTKHHSWNLHPDDVGLKQETFSVIVWGATLGTRNDTSHNKGLLCTVRYGRARTPWDEKLRGTGRISNTSEPMADSPTWNLGTLVTGSDQTELSVRVFALSEPDLSMPELHGKKLQGKRNLLGELSVGISTLLQASRNSVDGKASFKLPGGGHVRLTAEQGGAAPDFALARYGMTPSSSYEAFASIAGQQAVRVEDINGAGPMILGTAPLPPALQGIWWVNGPSAGSSLFSFGGPNNDGNGCSPGFISGEKNSYKVRAEGDRVVSMSDPSGLDKIVEAGDKVYDFQFDSAVNPVYARVSVLYQGLGFVSRDKWPELIMNSQMHLQVNGDVQYPGSVVWMRNTSIWGVNAMDAKFVQVIDGKGKKIEPAWSKFAAFEKDPEKGNYAGWMFFKSVSPSSSPWAVAVVEELLQNVRLHMILIMAGLLVLGGACCMACAYGCIRLHRSVRLLDVWQHDKRRALKHDIWIQ